MPDWICDWCKKKHTCKKNPWCHLAPEDHVDRCNTFDPDGHP